MIHDAMVQLTFAATKSSEPHQKMGRSRTKQDYHHCLKLLDWLALRNTFLVPDNNLHSLPTRLVSTEGGDINCEKAEDIGRTIQATLDNSFFNGASVKQKDETKLLKALQESTETAQGGDQSIDASVMLTESLLLLHEKTTLKSFFSMN